MFKSFDSPVSPSRNQPGPSTTQGAPEEPPYTMEQLEVVQRINNCKDLCQILGVTKASTVSDVKRAYKKMALQVHPDKNKAPGSLEAFQSLVNAKDTLTDNTVRMQSLIA